MTKIVLALTLIAFWLLIPIPLMIMGVGGFSEITTEDIQSATQPTTIQLLVNIGNYIGTYFKLMFFVIPNTNQYILRFVNFLQLLSGLFILVMIRGN